MDAADQEMELQKLTTRKVRCQASKPPRLQSPDALWRIEHNCGLSISG
jgi:hypothetical protein